MLSKFKDFSHKENQKKVKPSRECITERSSKILYGTKYLSNKRLVLVSKKITNKFSKAVIKHGNLHILLVGV